MSQLGSAPLIINQDLFTNNVLTPGNVVGSYAETADGRGFRYSKAGSTALVAGKVQQSQVESVANWENLTPAATAAGLKSITINSNTTVAANALAGGLAVITVTPGVGYSYRIASNNASTAGTGTSLVLTLEDPLVVALTTTSRIDVAPNPYDSVIVNPTSSTGTPVGVAMIATTVAGYSWLQTHGVCNVLADGAITVGAPVVVSKVVAGAVSAASVVTSAIIGYAVTGIADTEYGQVFLTID